MDLLSVPAMIVESTKRAVEGLMAGSLEAVAAVGLLMAVCFLFFFPLGGGGEGRSSTTSSSTKALRMEVDRQVATSLVFPQR